MLLQIGNRLAGETGEYEAISRPYATNARKSAHVRVKRVGNAEVTMTRTWGAHDVHSSGLLLDSRQPSP